MNDLSASAHPTAVSAAEPGNRTDPSPPKPPKRPIWRPLLPGATIRERLLACLGAAIGLGITGVTCALLTGGDGTLPLLVAPMGASAVLVFAVPTSPLAQPWPTIGGNAISAASGLAVVHFVPDPVLAAGVAVALAIVLMSALRCLHPPGGAAALLAAFGGPGATAMAWSFPLVPVALNAVLLVTAGWVFHRLCRRSYPHVAAPSRTHNTADLPAAQRVGFRPEDIDAALEKMGESFDISREDIDRLLRQVELAALVRSHPDITCADIMSRDVVSISRMADPGAARSYLLAHDVRALPVIDDDRQVVGIVGFKELQKPASRVSGMMERAVTARPDTPALELLDIISDGKAHAIVIVDEANRLQGIVTQTDLLAAISTGRLTARKAAGTRK